MVGFAVGVLQVLPLIRDHALGVSAWQHAASQGMQQLPDRDGI